MDFNNKVVKSAIKYLRQYKNVQVKRLDDPTGKTDVPLSTRTHKANTWGADILISCHHNAYTNKWGSHTGTETYTYVGNWKDAERLARIIQKRIVKAYGLADDGLKKADFHMLRESRMPAILIEGGYMDSTIDIKKLRNDTVLENVGKEIARGVAEYFGLVEGDQPENQPAPEQKTDAVIVNTPDKGKRVESIYKGSDGLDFYSKPTWDDKYKAGTFRYGMGWTIREKWKVDGYYMYEVENSKGDVYYITAADEYVKVIDGSKPSGSLPNTVYRATKPYPHGSGVRAVQEALASVYFYPEKGAKNNGIDGYYGPKTADAVRRFQLMHGLKQDGIYGPATRAKLLEVMR